MLASMAVSAVKYLCFGCEKCKGTEDELFVYLCTIYDKVYLGTKKESVHFFYIVELNTSNRLKRSIFNDIESVPKDRNMSERINSLTELMKRIKGCG